MECVFCFDTTDGLLYIVRYRVVFCVCKWQSVCVLLCLFGCFLVWACVGVFRSFLGYNVDCNLSGFGSFLIKGGGFTSCFPFVLSIMGNNTVRDRDLPCNLAYYSLVPVRCRRRM